MLAIRTPHAVTIASAHGVFRLPGITEAPARNTKTAKQHPWRRRGKATHART